MVRGNHVLPNTHFRKWLERHSKPKFNKPAKKEARRIARQDKFRKLGDRPLGLLRPIAHCPSQANNWRVREGRGFTVDELKAAKISRKFANSIGIAVDLRRKNRSQEGLDANVDRLKEYTSRLVVFPRKNSRMRKGIAGVPADTKRSSDLKIVSKGKRMRDVMPIRK